MTKELRIVHVTNTFADNGTGITNMLIDLADAQLAAGHQVVVMASTAESPAIDRLRLAGGSYVVIPKPDGVRSLMGAASLIRRHRTGALLHAHTVRAVAAIVAAGPLSFRRATVATVHNQFQGSAASMALLGATVCVSAANRRAYEATVVAKLGNFSSIPNGVVGSPRLEVGLAGATPSVDGSTILYAGGMSHRKGVDLLIRRFARVKTAVPGTRLILAGKVEPHVPAAIEDLGLSADVELLGYHPSPIALMRAATLVVVPSRREPFGLVAVEARAAGAAIVASDVDGLREALDGGNAGVLVDVDDDDAWVAHMVRLLEDVEARQDLKRKADVGLEKFTTERMAAGYELVYRDLLERKR